MARRCRRLRLPTAAAITRLRPPIPRLVIKTGTIRAGAFRTRPGALEPVFLRGQDIRVRIGRLSPGSRRLTPLPASLLLHAVLLVIMLLSFQRQRSQPALPLNGVSVVFETGLPHSNAVNAAPSRRITTLPSPTKGAPPPPAPTAESEVNLAQDQPEPFQEPEAAPRYIIPPPPPHPARRMARQAPRQNFLVMNGMSFNGPPQPTTLNPGHQGLDLQPANDNATQRSTLVEIQGHVGSGWDSALQRWAQSHIYYPEAAARAGQQGDVTVDLVIDRSGRVLSERLIRGSESAFLNMAWSGLWRDAHVPPFPPGTRDKTVKIRFTAQYRLVP